MIFTYDTPSLDHSKTVYPYLYAYKSECLSVILYSVSLSDCLVGLFQYLPFEQMIRHYLDKFGQFFLEVSRFYLTQGITIS